MKKGSSDTFAKANGRGRPKMSREETLESINEHLAEILNVQKARFKYIDERQSQILDTLEADCKTMTSLSQLIQYYIKTVSKRR